MVLPNAKNSITIPIPFPNLILLVKIGKVSNISAIAMAKQPTNIPAKIPKIARNRPPQSSGLETKDKPAKPLNPLIFSLYTEHKHPTIVPATIQFSYHIILWPVCVLSANLGTIPTVTNTVNTPPEDNNPNPKKEKIMIQYSTSNTTFPPIH